MYKTHYVIFCTESEVAAKYFASICCKLKLNKKRSLWIKIDRILGKEYKLTGDREYLTYVLSP